MTTKYRVERTVVTGGQGATSYLLDFEFDTKTEAVEFARATARRVSSKWNSTPDGAHAQRKARNGMVVDSTYKAVRGKSIKSQVQVYRINTAGPSSTAATLDDARRRGHAAIDGCMLRGHTQKEFYKDGSLYIHNFNSNGKLVTGVVIYRMDGKAMKG